MQTRQWIGNLAGGVAVALAAIALPALATAATHVVDDDGTYDAGTDACDGGDAAFTLIQAAVTAAANGDTILVCPGTYAEAQIVLNKALTVQSVAGAATTIIDGTGGTGLSVGGTVVINATAGNVLFDGFTLQNAKARTSNGARFNINVGSSAAVTFTVTNNVLLGHNNPADGGDYGLYAAGPPGNDTLVFQYNELLNHGSNTILIERHLGPTDVSHNTFTRGVRSGTISAYINMSHTNTAVTSLQRVSHNTIDMGNDPGPYNAGNSSSAIVFRGALTGTSLGTFSNVEITNNTITNLRSYRRAIVLANTANSVANQNLGLISNALISCNHLSWSGPAEEGSNGVRLLGYVTNTTITNNTIAGVDVGLMAEPNAGHIADTATFEENSVADTGAAAVNWQPSGALAAEDNWWGAASGPTHASNPSGTGGIILATGPVDFTPWLDSPSDADAGPCFVPGCGNGAADLYEDCDAGGLNGDPGSCCTTACTFRDAGEECRASAGTCDPAETCSGASGNCPADLKSSAVCRAAAGDCDVAEQCDGVGDDCPADAFLPAMTVCRAVTGGEVCDVAESCSGLSAACPADDVEPNTTVCRTAASTCDAAETCDGVAKTCPADAVEPNTTVCRSAAGACDLAESCDGSSVACPADAKSSAVCRPAAGDCDVAEQCDGVANACPSDAAQPDGTSCADGAFCNGDETCSSGVCSPGSGPCAMSETCDEATDLCFDGACPANAVACDGANKNRVLIRNKADNEKDKLIWKWTRGTATTQADFGDPTTSAAYALCFYAGPTASLINQITVPPAGGKWSPLGTKGYKYLDPSGTNDGITKVILKGGAAGKSKALVKGKGLALPDFDDDLPIDSGDLPLIVHLRNNGNGRCWEGSFASPKKNQVDQFKAKTP